MKFRTPTRTALWLGFLSYETYAFYLAALIVSQDEVGPMKLPDLVFGAAAFSDQYNTTNHLSSVIPLRTVRLALR